MEGERPSLNPMAMALKAVASLRLTVALLGLSIFLVFAGTLAQVDRDIWPVMEQYFRCWIAWIELKIFFPRDWSISGQFPYPGGWLLGTVLLANLLVSHTSRIRVPARGGRLLLGIGTLAIGVALTWIVISHVFEVDSTQKQINPTWRVTLQLLQGGGSAIVLFLGCWLVFRRKAGIVLLHSGIILLMFSELITGLTAEEAIMTIPKGQSSNFVEDRRKVELAIVDTSDPAADAVTAVPEAILAKGGELPVGDLPYTVEVVPGTFTKNSVLKEPGPRDRNPATRGIGLRVIADPKPDVSGVDTNGGVDFRAAYVKLTGKAGGEDLGTWLVSLEATMSDMRQSFKVGTRSYHLSIRFKRTYKSYTVLLRDLRLERYKGSAVARDYSSWVRLEDTPRDAVREARIWMNNPLRYRGETFYQSGIDEEGQSWTALQVVENRGWMVPYVACMIVGVGLLGQFLLHFAGFLRKQSGMV
jgi:hypothetical protein